METDQDNPQPPVAQEEEKADKPEGKKKEAKDRGPQLAFEISILCTVIIVLVGLVSLSGFMSLFMTSGQLGLYAEQVANLRALWVLVLLLFSIPPLFSPQLRMASAVGVVLALINVAQIGPALIPKAPKEKPVFFIKTLQIVHEPPATTVKTIARTFDEENPDVMAFFNVNWKTLREFNNLKTNFHYDTFAPDDRGYGVGLFSKREPLKGTRIKKLGPDKIPTIFSAVHFEFGWVRLVAFTVPEAKDAASFDKRNDFLKEVAGKIGDLRGPVLVLSNLNTTPYTGTFANFLKEARLNDSRAGMGVQPTFHIGPAAMIVNNVPTDFIFTNKLVNTVSRRVVSEYDGSHRPIVGEIEIKKNDVPYVEDKEPPKKHEQGVSSQPKKEQAKEAAAKKPTRKSKKKKRGKKRRRRRGR